MFPLVGDQTGHLKYWFPLVGDQTGASKNTKIVLTAVARCLHRTLLNAAVWSPTNGILQDVTALLDTTQFLFISRML